MVGCRLRLWLARARGGRDIHRGQDAEDVGLHHAGEQSERRHDDRKDEGRDGEQDADDHRPAHHVAEQTDRQGQRARDLADDVERQHDERRLHVGLEIAAQSLLRDAEERHGHQHAQRQRRRGRERAGRRLVAGNDGARLAAATNRNSVPRKPRYFRGWRRPTSSICFSMPVTTISSRFCQRERSGPWKVCA
jgi:hypothetical protein